MMRGWDGAVAEGLAEGLAEVVGISEVMMGDSVVDVGAGLEMDIRDQEVHSVEEVEVDLG